MGDKKTVRQRNGFRLLLIVQAAVLVLLKLFCLLLLHMDGWQIRGWDHIRKFIPLDWLVIFRRPHSCHNAAAPDEPIWNQLIPLEACGSYASFIYGCTGNWGMVSHPKIHPPRLNSDFQLALTKLLLCHNTCLILAFCGLPGSPGLSASFTYGRLANQGMGSHPKIQPTGLVSDFQADKQK